MVIPLVENETTGFFPIASVSLLYANSRLVGQERHLLETRQGKERKGFSDVDDENGASLETRPETMT